jgi:hypothetical protein
MAADHDFYEWNPTNANQETDAAYAADSLRSGGAVSGPWPPQSANKALKQAAIMVTALAQAMQSKGYTCVDGSTPFTANASLSTAALTLATVLENLVTEADLINTISLTGTSGYVQFGAAVNRLVVQWGRGGAASPLSPTSVTFPINFPTTCVAVVLTPVQAGGTISADSITYPPTVTVLTTSGFTWEYNGSGSGLSLSNNWIAIGY